MYLGSEMIKYITDHGQTEILFLHWIEPIKQRKKQKS